MTEKTGKISRKSKTMIERPHMAVGRGFHEPAHTKYKVHIHFFLLPLWASLVPENIDIHDSSAVLVSCYASSLANIC